MKPVFLLFLTSLLLCGCSQTARDPNAWSPDPANRGKALFEGTRMGWNAAAADDEH